MENYINIDLTVTDCQVLVVALHDMRTVTGMPAWDAPAVARLRAKIADALGEQILQETTP
jgi:hypothetical protein